MNALISVIIPSYNHESYIVEALESVLAQSYPNVEIVIVDDGSTDNTLEKISSYHSPKVKIVVQENQGANVAINKGISLARGEFVTVLNSDDLYHPQRLERLMAEQSNLEGQALIFTSLTMIDASGKPYDDIRWEQYQTLQGQCRHISRDKYFLMGNVAYTTSNFFMRRAFFDRVGSFKKLRYTHDWNFALRSSVLSSPVWLQEDLLFYRVHEKNTLNETSLWFSILEDSYNFSCYLFGRLRNKVSLTDVFEWYFSCFARNASYLPLFVSFFYSLLVNRVVADEDELLQCIHDEKFCSKMRRMVENVSYDMSTYQSLPYMNSVIQSYTRQVEMIKERDLCIRNNEANIEQLKQYMEKEIVKVEKALKSTMDYKLKRIIKKIFFP